MTEREKGWVAGLIEGEGCFSVNRLPQYLSMRIQMTDLDVLERLQSLIGGKLRPIRKRQPHHKDTWELGVRKREEVLALMELIRPDMGQRRGAKIDELLAGAADAPARQSQ